MSPETIDAMLAAGATAEVLAAAWKAEIAIQEKALAEKREKDAIRQRRHRESRDVTVTACDDGEKVSLEVSPHTPLPKPLPKSTPLYPPIPDWLPEAEWSEFRRMRKAMRNVPFTPDAEKRVIAKIDKLRGEGHCPAKLLAKAIERGHRSVFEDETTKTTARPLAEQSPEQRLAKLKSDIAFYSKIGRDDDVREARRKLAELEGPPANVVQLARQVGSRA